MVIRSSGTSRADRARPAWELRPTRDRGTSPGAAKRASLVALYRARAPGRKLPGAARSVAALSLALCLAVAARRLVRARRPRDPAWDGGLDSFGAASARAPAPRGLAGGFCGRAGHGRRDAQPVGGER